MPTELCAIVAKRTHAKPLRYSITYQENGRDVPCDRICEILGEERLETEERRLRGIALNRLASANSIEIPCYAESPEVVERETINAVIQRHEKAGRVEAANQARNHLESLDRPQLPMDSHEEVGPDFSLPFGREDR